MTSPALIEAHLTGWRVSAGNEQRVFDATGNRIVDVPCGGMSGRTSDEAADVARLIAAAPDMLATLERYADTLCEGWCEKSPDCANFDDCGGCEARRTAEKALGQ